MKTKDFTGIRNNGSLPSPVGTEVYEEMADMLTAYAESALSMLDELEQVALAYESGDNRQENAEAARRILHKLKGESGMVGADTINELCHQAEYAFEELAEQERADMLLRIKDWACEAINSMTA